jgi:hypothetical protein
MLRREVSSASDGSKLCDAAIAGNSTVNVTLPRFNRESNSIHRMGDGSHMRWGPRKLPLKAAAAIPLCRLEVVRAQHLCIPRIVVKRDH